MQIAIRDGRPVLVERVDARRGAAAQAQVDGNGTAHEVAAARSATPAGFCARASYRPAFFRLEKSGLARRHSQTSALAFCGSAGSPCASRLLDERASCRRVVTDRMAESEPGPTKYWLSTLSAETKLRDLVRLAKHRWIIERDYEELKQELGLGHYEGTRLARISPSRHPVHSCLWVPGGRTEPFFPLGSRRPLAPIHAANPAPLPTPRIAPYAPSGIIPGPSLLYDR